MKESKVWKLMSDLVVKRTTGLASQRSLCAEDGREEVTLPPGTWLLELYQDLPTPPDTISPAGYCHHYRLVTGETVMLTTGEVTSKEAELVTDPQATAAMMGLRPVSETIQREHGLHLSYLGNLSPFSLLRCPLCGADRFETVEFAVALCHYCLARFEIRPTSDWFQGWNCTVTLGDVDWREARIHIPAGRQLRLTLLVADGWMGQRHPLDMSTDHCNCKPGNPLLTDKKHWALRSGLHLCNLGFVGRWQLEGHVPSPGEDVSTSLCLRPRTWKLGKLEWPRCAMVEVNSILPPEKRRLVQNLLQEIQATRTDDDDIAYLKLIRRWTTLPLENPRVWIDTDYAGAADDNLRCRPQLPLLSELDEDEQFILYTWHLIPRGSPFEYHALPGWLIAKPGFFSTWGEVVEKHICPICTQEITQEDVAVYVSWANKDDKAPGELPHRDCWKAWKELSSYIPRLYQQAGSSDLPAQADEIGGN